MRNNVNGLLEELITKAEVLWHIIKHDPAGLNGQAFIDATNALVSLKLLRVELSR